MTRPTKRDLEDLRRLRRNIRWLDQCREVKRGRRPLDLFEDFSVSRWPEKDVYVVRYKICGTSYVAVVKARKRRIGNRPDLVVSTPRQTFLAISKYNKHGHHSPEAFAEMLAKKFAKKLGELKLTN